MFDMPVDYDFLLRVEPRESEMECEYIPPWKNKKRFAQSLKIKFLDIKCVELKTRWWYKYFVKKLICPRCLLSGFTPDYGEEKNRIVYSVKCKNCGLMVI